MVKNPKNLKKSQEITFNFFYIYSFFYFGTKNCYPLIFPILGGRDLTRALQYSPFQKYKNLEKSQKSPFSYFLLKLSPERKKYAILLVLQY